MRTVPNTTCNIFVLHVYSHCTVYNNHQVTRYKRRVSSLVHTIYRNMYLPIMPYQPPQRSIHEEINLLTATEGSARNFLRSRNVLKTSMTCSCLSPMGLTPCTESKSADLSIWRCVQMCSDVFRYVELITYCQFLMPTIP